MTSLDAPPSAGTWTWRRRGWMLLLGLVVLYSLVHFAYSGLYFPFHSEGADFRSVFPGKLMFRITEIWPSLAKDWINFTGGFVFDSVSWNYGPVVHFLTAPFVFVTTKSAALTLILLFNLGFVAMSFFLWVRLLFGDRPRLWAVLGLACIWMNYFPLLEAIAGREVELFELWLITVSVWALRRRREVLAGAAIGVAAMTKFLPVIFIPYLLLTRFRKAFWVAVVTLLLIAGLGQWLLGFQHSVTMKVLFEEVQAKAIPSSAPHQSMPTMLHKMFTLFDPYENHPVTLYPKILHPVGMVLSLGVLLACGGLLFRHRRKLSLERDIALLAVVMVLVAPHSNHYYLVFALPALSVGFAAWVANAPPLNRVLKAGLAASVVLSGFLLPMGVVGRVVGVPGDMVTRVLQLYSLPAVGLMLAAIVMVGLYQASADRTADQLPGRVPE